jgi:uncharacterized membrane protein
MEKPIRSLLKSISWRIVATLTTIVLVFSLTGNLVISGSVGLLELVTKTLIYFLHERIWNAIDFGRK